MGFIEQNITLTEEIKAYALENDMDVFGICRIDVLNKNARIGRRPYDLFLDEKAILVFGCGMADSLSRCGECSLCENFCPAKAFSDGEYCEEKCYSYIENPDNQLKFSKHSWMKCDMCMRICPLGEKGSWDTVNTTWEQILLEKKINY